MRSGGWEPVQVVVNEAPLGGLARTENHGQMWLRRGEELDGGAAAGSLNREPDGTEIGNG
jgi:hypothetical protein